MQKNLRYKFKNENINKSLINKINKFDMEDDPLDQQDIEKLLIIKKVFSIISLIVFFLIAFLFWFSRKIKKKMVHMNILYLAIIEIGYLISLILPYNYNEPDDDLCFAQSLLINFFTHSKYVWCILMIYTSIMESLFKARFENNFVIFSLISIFVLILIPFFSSLFLFLNKLSGNYGVYCYLPLNNSEMRFYVNRIHIYFTSIKAFFIIITFYGIYRSKRNKTVLKTFIKFTSNHKYLIYTKIICFLQTLDLITNIYKIIKINSSSFWIELLHIIFNCGEGILIFITFLRSQLFQILFSQLYKSIKKRKKKKKRNKKSKRIENINKIMNDNDIEPLIDNAEIEDN